MNGLDFRTQKGKQAIEPVMWDLLHNSTLTVPEIAEKLGISDNAIRSNCRKRNYDLAERTRRIKNVTVFRKSTRKASAVLTSRLDESMTGDGFSLAWLSKEWK